MGKIIWQLPTHQSNVTCCDWIHPKAKFHAFDGQGVSLCKKHRQANDFEQYDFNDTLKEFGEKAFCKICYKKYLKALEVENE